MKKLLSVLVFLCILSVKVNADPPVKLDKDIAEKMIKHIKDRGIKKRKIITDAFDPAELATLIKGATSVKFILGARLKSETGGYRNYPVIIMQVVRPEKDDADYYLGAICPPPTDCPFPFTTR